MYFNNLKKLRTDKDLTQEDVARLLNCKRSSYSNWEYDIVMIPLDIADKLAIFYNVKLSYILGIDNINKIDCKLEPINYKILLKNLYKLKKKNKHSFEDIADYLKCNKSTCSRYFKGTIKIPIDRLILLSKLYNIELDILCGKITKQTNTIKN